MARLLAIHFTACVSSIRGSNCILTSSAVKSDQIGSDRIGLAGCLFLLAAHFVFLAVERATWLCPVMTARSDVLLRINGWPRFLRPPRRPIQDAHRIVADDDCIVDFHGHVLT
ncbi:hypothetical protein F4823DRAFT_342404 [Ustulina deusta]|nr:hypothetical protein F4823DRAFT_342404 [Ustulina deusta]